MCQKVVVCLRVEADGDMLMKSILWECVIRWYLKKTELVNLTSHLSAFEGFDGKSAVTADCGVK